MFPSLASELKLHESHGDLLKCRFLGLVWAFCVSMENFDDHLPPCASGSEAREDFRTATFKESHKYVALRQVHKE